MTTIEKIQHEIKMTEMKIESEKKNLQHQYESFQNDVNREINGDYSHVKFFESYTKNLAVIQETISNLEYKLDMLKYFLAE